MDPAWIFGRWGASLPSPRAQLCHSRSSFPVGWTCHSVARLRFVWADVRLEAERSSQQLGPGSFCARPAGGSPSSGGTWRTPTSSRLGLQHLGLGWKEQHPFLGVPPWRHTQILRYWLVTVAFQLNRASLGTPPCTWKRFSRSWASPRMSRQLSRSPLWVCREVPRSCRTGSLQVLFLGFCCMAASLLLPAFLRPVIRAKSVFSPSLCGCAPGSSCEGRGRVCTNCRCSRPTTPARLSRWPFVSGLEDWDGLKGSPICPLEPHRPFLSRASLRSRSRAQISSAKPQKEQGDELGSPGAFAARSQVLMAPAVPPDPFCGLESLFSSDTVLFGYKPLPSYGLVSCRCSCATPTRYLPPPKKKKTTKQIRT